MTVIVQARLEELKLKIEVRMRRSVVDILQIGEWLAEARTISLRGEWESWLKTTGITPRMANHWIHAYGRFGVSVNFTDKQLPASAMLLLAAPSTPEGALNEVRRRLENGETFTGDQVEEILNKYRVLEGVQVGSQALLATYGTTESGRPAKVIPRSAVTSSVFVAEEMLKRGAIEIEGEDHPVPDIKPEVMTQPIPDVPALDNTFQKAVRSQSKQRQQGHIESGTNPGATGISIVVYKGDPARTLKALREVLPATELYRLQDLIATRG